MYKSFTFTISVVEGVEEDFQEYLIKWLSKQDFALGVIEKNKAGVLHAHGQIWNHKASLTKHDKFKVLKEYIKKNCPLSYGSIALNIKIAYNNGYIDYCEKDAVRVLANNLPSGDHPDSYWYPSQEEQEKVKAVALAADKKYHNYKCDYEEWSAEMDPPDPDFCWSDKRDFLKKRVATFLNEMIYIEKKYPVISQKKIRIEVCKNLYMYIYSIKSLPEFFSQEDWEKMNS
jgi:hypothetical protein